MPFEAQPTSPRKIAVIGGGITGMGAAYKLSGTDHVTLFEAEPRIGGHARTRMAGPNGDQSVDTGFIVFNYANYPHLTALFDELDVPVVKSNMSFGASINGGGFEYGLRTLSSLFAQPKHAISPRFLRMVRDIFKFNSDALELSRRNTSMTIGEMLTALGTSDWFRERYLLPLSGAIWSTPLEKIMDFPAYAMMQFFENHALLSHTGQHQWYTVEGGSISYVSRLQSALEKANVSLRVSSPIDAVRRNASGAMVKTADADWEQFDEVIFATHSDDSLRMIEDAEDYERSALSKVAYQPNKIVLHSDDTVMPKRRAVWSSWNYTEMNGRLDGPIDLTYWMNSLQPWLTRDNFFVTLNTNRSIRPELIWDEVTLRHPVYDLGALEAQKEVTTFNGRKNTWFCGAWMKNGFHEDGLSSALDVVNGLQAEKLSVAAQ
ncbi:cyclopropane-fatty-acyl-phospholipid synthase [Marivivens niveibacter]|uniref:Cyclopropane-fatty-acyl-phospholipid synthase n=1 Tax=Marivivens niveibacter TaxID=1930667 RepID=A0A251WZD5_9RHOB|nr:FAD-dependent oxidoreductase [Marivivens niveibacter]OUD09505.1 cyclopropane-fatty-acyl-phospholipid synthase [Marivivens niveibacter]